MGAGLTGKAPQTNDTWNQVYQSYAKSLPDILNATSTGQTAADLAAAKSSAATTPIYSQTGLENLQQYAVPYAQAGAAAQDVTQKAGAQTQQDIMSQYGPAYAQQYRSMDQAANPEYYKTLGTATDQANNLVNSINLNGLSGSERAEVERSLNQSNTATGNLGLDNATNAVSNAMTFGSAMQKKRDALGSALSTATNLLGQSKNGFNPSGVMTNSATTNMGTNNFSGVQQSGNQAYGLGAVSMGGLSQLASTNAQSQWDSNKRASGMGIADSVTSGIGNICCFIFLEIHNGKLPWYVRACRDQYYLDEPKVALGYRRMARWLVPLMRASKILSALVNTMMVRPLTQHGAWICDAPGGTKHSTIKRLWFNVWKFMGSY